MAGLRSSKSSGKQKLVPIVGAVLGLVVFIIAFVIISRPPRVYGLMIDAGSTGSRMHTFIFSKTPQGDLKLVKEDFNPIKPGLSAFKDDPAAAGASLLPLLEKSKRIVPSSQHSSTPVFLRATAGLRMLGGELSEKILNEVRATLGDSGFRFDSPDWAGVLGENDEGIYSWITVNYLLGRSPDSTAGTLEMGGGSSQITFVPSTETPSGENCSLALETTEYKGANLGLYTVSHLGFGIKKAMEEVVKESIMRNITDNHPCFSSGMQEIDLAFLGAKVVVNGVGNYALCGELIRDVLMDGAGQCNCGVCTYARAPLPKAAKDYVALAFYAERTTDLGLTNPVSMADIRELGERICQTSVVNLDRHYPNVANGDASDLCFDLSFIYQHLTHGHGIFESLSEDTPEPEITMAKTLKGVELGWSLGAMFAEMTRLQNQSNPAPEE